MASIISAGTTSGTALNMAGDTSGQLQLATNGSTTAVTIDTSQNVGIGTTSPSVKLHLKGASFANAIRWEETGGSNNFYAGPFDSSGNFGLDNNSASGYTRFVTNSTERMRIDSSGNVMINTTTAAASTGGLNINSTASGSEAVVLALMNRGTANNTIATISWRGLTNVGAENDYGYIKMIEADTTAKSSALSFWTQSSGTLGERMRIDTSGNFLVGTTTGLDSGNGATIKQASYYISSYRVSSTAGNYIHAFYSDVGGTATAKYAIYANGTAGAISDERFKKNIEPARNYLEDLTKIDVIKYNWATDEDEAPKELGFSAQQVETIFPGLVDTIDNKDADGNVLINQKILKRDVFLPMLVKAIQEQQTIINDLKARITALEGAA
jgi:hypothetical protein